MAAPVHILPHDPEWPLRFEQERELLGVVLAQWLVGSIEHIGSTSVPGLSAKPILDIMAGVASLPESEPAIQALAPHGYCYFPYKATVMHWFCKPSEAVRTHHLHLVPFQSELWHERLLFRDALRGDARLAAEYERLKLELAEKHRYDREVYTEAKTSFITAVVKGAGSRL